MKGNVRRSFLFNLAVVILLGSVLFASFFASLQYVTRHGQEVKMPDVTGQNVAVAVAQLRNMHFDVHIDSVYQPAVKPLAVIMQVPENGAAVKEGRIVFITVNMHGRQML